MIAGTQNHFRQRGAMSWRRGWAVALLVAMLGLAQYASGQSSTNAGGRGLGEGSSRKEGNTNATNIGTPDPLPQQAQLIQQLLNRLDQFEKRDSERDAALAQLKKSHEDREQRLLQRIGELESKVGSLEAGRVLPEIAVTPEPGPSLTELDQQVRIQARNNELAVEAAEARAKEAPRLSIGQSGFSLASADTNFVLKLRGLVQLDSRTFFDDNPLSEGNDAFLLRRARPIIEGTVFRDFDFQFVPDFGGSSVAIFDAWLNYRYEPWLQLRAGKFKGPVGFENLQSDATLPFNERSLVSGFVPSRSLGIQIGGEAAEGRFSYAAGVFNGSGDARNPNNTDFNDHKEFAGRLGFQPFKQSANPWIKELGFGMGGSFSQVKSNSAALPNSTGGTLAGYFTPGQQQYFAYNPLVGQVVGEGDHWRISPYVTYLRGPFGLLAEYLVSRQGVINNTTLARADLQHAAWQVSGQWVITGEAASFSGITPNRPFDLHSGNWGAWQLVARYSQADLDDSTFPSFANAQTSASGATSWSVGVNWWLNKNVRVLTSFSHTKFEGGGAFGLTVPGASVPPATVARQDENTLFTRVQLSF